MASKWAKSEGFDKDVEPNFKAGAVVELTTRYRFGGPAGRFKITRVFFDSVGEWLVDLRVLSPAGHVRHANWVATRYPAFWFQRQQ
jgi:hypothetical protein